MKDYPNVSASGRFRNLEVDESAPASPQGAPARQSSLSPGEWFREYIGAYLEQLPWRERSQRLLAALGEGSVEAIFGDTDISSRDLIWAQGFANNLASLSQEEQINLRETFSEMARERLEVEFVEAFRRGRAEGETEADSRHSSENEETKSVLPVLKRRFGGMSGRLRQALVLGVLLVGSAGFTVWLVGLINPQVAQVTIEYNVGEIIGALLGGAGAAAAGIGYAAKTLRNTRERENSLD